MNGDDPRFPQLIEHLVIDFAGGADRGHIHELVLEVLEAGPREAYLAITIVSSLSASLIRATFADELAQHADCNAFFGLDVDPRAGLDTTTPEYRCAVAAAQAMTAALNDDRETAAAVVMAIVKADDDDAAANAAHLLVAALRIFSQLYNSPDGRAGWEALGRARRGGTDAGTH